MDGEPLDQSNYTVKEGSTIVTLQASYLNTLELGKHTVCLLWTDGSASTTFTIRANTSDNSSNNQKQNDSNNHDSNNHGSDNHDSNNHDSASDDSTLPSDIDRKDDVPNTGDSTLIVWLYF